MSARPPIRKALAAKPDEDDRASPAKDKRKSLSWVRDVLSRSIGLEQRRNQLHVVLVDQKRGGVGDQPSSLLLQQRAELGARLLLHDPATQAVRHLFLVHDELGRTGWAAVEAMSPQVVSRALAEAEMLVSEEASPLMTTIIERLRAQKDASDRRVENAMLLRELEQPPEVPEVYEATHEEYELMERSWIGTVPSGLELTDRPVTRSDPPATV